MKTRSFEALIEVKNETERLLPGMIARETLDTRDGETGDGDPERLVIAQDWLVTHPDGVGAFIEVDGVARWRSLSLGEVLRTQVVVENGLSAGDSLIITGHRELVDGDRVLVHRRGRCCTDGRVSFEQ
jgi:membrane fusion protein (multidrug efflux system)